jgi:hypothetical protein
MLRIEEVDVKTLLEAVPHQSIEGNDDMHKSA